MTDNQLYHTLKNGYDAPFKGWDFSYLNDRMMLSPLPWNYKSLVETYIIPDTKLLDIDTGDGTFLNSLEHLPIHTFATEGYLPNFEIASKQLAPKNIEVECIKGDKELPFDNQFFDVIINRHGAFNIDEIKRLLKPNGVFITQQVGSLNTIDLNMSLGATANSLQDWGLIKNRDIFSKKEMRIVASKEDLGTYRFYDIGAIAYYLKAILWQIPDFSIETYFDRLKQIHKTIQEQGHIEFLKHRFYMIVTH